MVRDLVESAIDMVRTERESEVEDLARERVDERLLDLLLPAPEPPATKKPEGSAPPPAPDAQNVFVVSTGGDVSREDQHPDERHNRTRQKLKQLLRDAQLE